MSADRTVDHADPVIRAEAGTDLVAIASVHAAAFDHAHLVPELVDRLRVAPARLPPVSLVATVDSRLERSPAYYGRRGFQRADQLRFRAPSLRIPPAAFQVAVLTAYRPRMTGTHIYARTFWDLDCVGLRDPDEASA
jgi:predicted N-acetyltransferase YhbS